MQQYLKLVRDVLRDGEKKEDRTGTGTISFFGEQMRFDLREGFPLLTTKKVVFDSVVRELLWFIKGATNINDGLFPHTKIWNNWADENGELGPIYGYQWRKWEQFKEDGNGGYHKTYIDQLKNAIEMIKQNPDSRRIIVSSWNVSDIDQMALPPCHSFFQFNVCQGQLDLQLYQRSADIALGVPFNIASYALLLLLVAQECALTPRYFIHTLGDAHIYLNHIEGLEEQLKRSPTALPLVTIANKSVFDVTFEDIQLHHYEPAPFIKFSIAV
jgi:thymidylate synthase